MSTKIDVSSQGADALREFAAAMKLAQTNIEESTLTMSRGIVSRLEELGPAEENFRLLLASVEKSKKHMEEVLEILPPRMVYVAEAIEQYVQENGNGKK